MVVTGAGESLTGDSLNYDRQRELKAFDESKSGVKGLVDAGVAKIPRIFIRPPEELARENQNSGDLTNTQFVVPVIDLGDIIVRSADKVAGVRRAAEEVGFFQVVNHGIPKELLEQVLKAVRGFHELPREVKADYYTRELMRKVKFGSNFDLYESSFANWRDTLFCVMAPEPLDPQELPPVCRDITIEYSKQARQLGIILLELLSEALGLNPNHLIDLDCAKGTLILGHYYPACPEPELTMGTSKHSDPDFLTILLQDHIGGLQILHQDRWIDVPSVPGALVVNIGDLLQDRQQHCFSHSSSEKIMEITADGEVAGKTPLSNDRKKEIKDFDNTKAGVKGLVDAGISNTPKIFIRPADKLAEELSSHGGSVQLPVISLDGIQGDARRKEIIANEVKEASEKWGFFQVVNHGIPSSLLGNMIEGIRKFNDQDLELKKEFYSRDRTRNVVFNSNFDLRQSHTANWRDNLIITSRATHHFDPSELPAVCRSYQMTCLKALSIGCFPTALDLWHPFSAEVNGCMAQSKS
ncbi:hypothetical protein I3842_01G186700 [Carya illinoinensis]|uniref:Fe2OG dioxygenase domain-containing protein n=2 Tax=Carya illinoinensis TaxID=32201 RepID=A0A922KCW4_CARIL|nr:hypothetical protein I3842_01G186700 [Carya illinoinensis]